MTKKHDRNLPEVARMYFVEGMNYRQISRKIPASSMAISSWITNFKAECGDNYETAMKKYNTYKDAHASRAELLREISDLRRRLEDKTMEADLYNEMIKIAEEEFKIPIRKNGMPSSEEPARATCGGAGCAGC
ncbi:MAG: hypothetical protein LKK12_05490 [Bacteroidales bacterium]|nr:hypothetical protein [Bacteroidales bacterium]MCI2133819.1 hypothetical protein [Bacteroidales bacterium]